MKCFQRNTFHHYVRFQALDTFLRERKKNFKRNLFSCKEVYITLDLIFYPFLKSLESDLQTILLAFFPAEYEYQSLFFRTRPAFPKRNVKNLIRIIILGIYRSQLLHVWWSFQRFLGSQGGLHGRFWPHMKFISIYALLFGEIV